MHVVMVGFNRRPLWSLGNIVASHLVGPGSIPGRKRVLREAEAQIGL